MRQLGPGLGYNGGLVLFLTQPYRQRGNRSSSPTPVSSFKIPHVIGDKDQQPKSNPGCVQTEMIMHHVRFGRA
ncbi:hypothetical protein TNCV_368681 [Trichonephila clavipes]|nr:hypothetical protein TNCV_368681 [Trichonephila clavipes]